MYNSLILHKKYLPGLLVMLSLFTNSSLHAQLLNYTVGAGATLSNTTAPIYRSVSNNGFNNSRFVSLYTASEISASGILVGSTLNAISFYKSNTGSTVTNNLSSVWKIYIKQSNTTPTNTWCNANFATQTSDYTLVYANTSQIIPAAIGWITLNLATPIVYNGGTLEIASFWDCSAYTAGAPNSGSFQWKTDNLSNYTCGVTFSSTSTQAMSYNSSRPQIRFTVTPPACSGMPTPGNTLTTATQVCPNTPFTLSFQNSSPYTGVSYQWQQADDLAFTQNVLNLGTATTQIISNLPSSKYFRCKATCTNNTTPGYSTPILITSLNMFQCYCKPNITNTQPEYYSYKIDNLKLVDGNVYPQNCSAYQQFCEPYSYCNPAIPYNTTTLLAGNSYIWTFNVQSAGNEFTVGAWVDLNNDGTLSSNELVGYTPIGSMISFASNSLSITIPSNISPGVHRLRILGAFTTQYAGAAILPCGSYSEAICEDFDIHFISANPVQVDIKCFLQGLYVGNNLMTPSLSGPPTPYPYCDQVTVELHDANSPYGLSYSFNGMVKTDGTLSCFFPNTCLGSSYYLVLKHRNSIETWSATPITISTNTNYDFTTTANKSFGDNSASLAGVWGLFSGDINQDAGVDLFDYLLMDAEIASGASGYLAADLNGDGFVDLFDYLLLDPNIGNGSSVFKP